MAATNAAAWLRLGNLVFQRRSAWDAVMHHDDSVGCSGYPEQKKNLRLDAILPKADIP
jgi:hypothetical protein